VTEEERETTTVDGSENQKRIAAFKNERAIRRSRIAKLNASADRPNCRHCKKPMRVFSCFDSPWAIERGLLWGLYGDGIFCSASCGYAFGLLAIKAGFVVVKGGV
jgi:hypothetical protein